MLMVLVIMAFCFGSMGSFQFKKPKMDVTLVVEHQGCTMLQPKAGLNNLESVGSAVKLKTGRHRFRFDCEGKIIEADYSVTTRDRWVKFEPEVGFTVGEGDPPSTGDVAVPTTYVSASHTSELQEIDQGAAANAVDVR